jgi:uncharacterized phiE125 gp8 family phage protein
MLTLVTPPAVEPVTLAEAKLHCRVEADNTYNDSLITTLIQAAREWVEKELDRSLIDTTWDYYLEDFPGCHGDKLVLPRPPLRSVTHVKYVDDGSGSLITLAVNTDYRVFTPSKMPGFLRPAYNVSWPGPRDQSDAVQVRFVAGYGATAASVPACLKAGIKLLVGHWFENREEVVVGTVTKQIEMGVLSVISPENWGSYA